MQITCIACDPATQWATEKEYQDHLVSFHGTSSPDEAVKLERAKKKNSPVKLPPGIPEAAAPTEEFTKTMQEIERAKASQVTPPPTPAPQPQIKIEDRPIILGYKYSGTCTTCHNDVKTLELDADGKHFAVAYCLFCNRQLESREVVNLVVEEAIGHLKKAGILDKKNFMGEISDEDIKISNKIAKKYIKTKK